MGGGLPKVRSPYEDITKEASPSFFGFRGRNSDPEKTGFRGRNSDPESPPGPIGENCAQGEEHLGDLDLGYALAYSDPETQKKTRLRYLCLGLIFLVIIYVVWSSFSLIERRAPPQPQTKLRGLRLEGHEPYADIKICDRDEPCEASCHTMDSARVVNLMRESIHEIDEDADPFNEESQKRTELMNADRTKLKCDGPHYVSISICNNPGGVPIDYNSDENHRHPPRYYLATHEPTEEEACSRSYPSRPLRVQLDEPSGTKVYFSVCIDGNRAPIMHSVTCE